LEIEKVMLKKIPGFDGYLASHTGSVYSNKKQQNKRQLRPRIDKSTGYQKVTLYRESKAVTIYLHQVIAITFHGDKRAANMMVAHLDANKMNCVASNLEWKTYLGNAKDRDAHGNTCRGSKSKFSKLTEEKVEKIFEMLQGGLLIPSIASAFGVSERTIYSIAAGATWRHVHTKRSKNNNEYATGNVTAIRSRAATSAVAL
jgi:predicted lipase